MPVVPREFTKKQTGRGSKLLIWGTSVATPFACAFEWLMRKAFFPADFEEIRSFLRPHLATPAYVCAAVTLLLALAAIRLQDTMTARSLAKMTDAQREGDDGRKARNGAFMVTTTLPQLSALASTFAFTFGAPFAPVALTMLVASAGVIVQGVRAYR